MSFYENFLRLCNQTGKSPSRVVLEVGGTKSAVTRWKNGGRPTDATARKIADHFGVSVSQLLDGELGSDSQTPAAERPISDRELRFALWGDDLEMSQEDLEDVRRYAAFVAERKKREK